MLRLLEFSREKMACCWMLSTQCTQISEGNPHSNTITLGIRYPRNTRPRRISTTYQHRFHNCWHDIHIGKVDLNGCCAPELITLNLKSTAHAQSQPRQQLLRQHQDPMPLQSARPVIGDPSRWRHVPVRYQENLLNNVSVGPTANLIRFAWILAEE